MVTDRQVRLLMKELKKRQPLATAAAKAGMCEKTARRYRRLGMLPSEARAPHTWRTREDPFEAVWPAVCEFLRENEGLEAKTLFEWVRREHPGRFSDGQLRTFQRRVKAWRAVEGQAREVMFPQVHEPARLGQSDFTHLDKLHVTIQGRPFPHMLFHFVLTFSNWETGTVCFTESFESLAHGLQNALFELGGAPRMHQTDSLTAAVNKLGNVEEFTARYRALLAHYGMQGLHGQPGKAHENGDIEQRHHRFKRALEQRLIVRGSRDFESREAYEDFLRVLFDELNKGRSARFEKERPALHALPRRRWDAASRLRVKVGASSTIRVQNNRYSVHSRLIGETVEVRILPEQLEVRYGQKRVELLPRLRGRGRCCVNYRHIIDWLVRKPGAFERYRYREALFPTSRFRLAHDLLRKSDPLRGHKQYLAILELAARENETAVDECLRRLIDAEQPISPGAVRQALRTEPALSPPRDARVDAVNLAEYDALCNEWRHGVEEWEAVACL